MSIIKFVEDTIRNINVMQLADGIGRHESVNSMFEKLRQSPQFSGSRDLFVEYLNKLKENAHYKRDAENNVQNQYHEEMDSDQLIPGQIKIHKFVFAYFIIYTLLTQNCTHTLRA